MSGRFTVTDLPGSPARIEKRGDPDAVARDAAALARLVGAPWAPALLSHGEGVLVSTRLPGAPRPAAAIDAGDARRLGLVLADLHRRGGAAAAGGLWWWDAPAITLAAYRTRRIADAERALAGTPHAGLAAAAPPGPADADDPAPFRMAHGDLVLANVVWGPDGPGLVDWEFWRMADPAEDLAYLIAVNGLPAPLGLAVLDGYGDPAVAARVPSWVPVVRADAAGWYVAHGMAGEAEAVLAGPGPAVTPGPPRPAGRAR